MKNAKITIRTSAGLRDALFDTLDDIRNRRISAREASATAQLAWMICRTVEMEAVVPVERDPLLLSHN